jgi:hypothetical protein
MQRLFTIPSLLRFADMPKCAQVWSERLNANHVPESELSVAHILLACATPHQDSGSEIRWDFPQDSANKFDELCQRRLNRLTSLLSLLC